MYISHSTLLSSAIQLASFLLLITIFELKNIFPQSTPRFIDSTCLSLIKINRFIKFTNNYCNIFLHFYLPQHFLYFFSLPQIHGSLRPQSPQNKVFPKKSSILTFSTFKTFCFDNTLRSCILLNIFKSMIAS
jgi:hypothetical protein